MVTKLNVPPFVIILVTYTIALGVALAITNGIPINGISPAFTDVSSNYVVSIPVPLLFFVAAGAGAWFFLERTYQGRQVYAGRAVRHRRLPGDRPAGRRGPVGRRFGLGTVGHRRRGHLLALKVSPYDQQIVLGAVLGIAILADRLRARRFGRIRH
jgi:ribose transport system permease protein